MISRQCHVRTDVEDILTGPTLPYYRSGSSWVVFRSVSHCLYDTTAELQTEDSPLPTHVQIAVSRSTSTWYSSPCTPVLQ